MRAIVGDCSIPPPRLLRPVLPIIGRNHVSPFDSAERPEKRPFINPLRLFLYPEVTALLLFNGVIYAVFYGVLTSISTLFQQIYPYLNVTNIGLCFLAVGGGMLIGTTVNGRVLDREYRVIRERLVQSGRLSADAVARDDNFPIEYARFRTMPVWVAIYVVACVGYGWTLQSKVSIAAPLVLHVISKFSHFQTGCLQVLMSFIL